VLSERLITSFAQEQPKGRLALSEVGANSQMRKVILANTTYTLPTISDATTGCAADTWASTSTINAPTARFAPAVWTGSEMIVWGGWTGSNYLNTGGRYNPSTDSWTATSTHNAPAARAVPAVWTGSEMIVWGGSPDAFDEVRHTGGRYNPGTDSWTATSLAHAPHGRDNHTAVWTGSEIIVWGGEGTSLFNTGGRYCATAAPRP
jgi:hypothetical protein